MLLKNNLVYDFDHRAYFLRGHKDSTLLAASEEGVITVLNPENGSLKSVTLATKIREISFSNLNRLIALIDDATGNLVIVDFEGQVLFQDKPPQMVNNHPFYGFLSCFFSENEKHLWCAVRLSENETELQLREVKEFNIASKTIVSDPFRYSHFLFYSTKESNVVALCVIAGQDGAEVWWLKNDNGEINYQKESKLLECTPPIFAPNGSEFLLLYDHEAFYQYQYPDVQKIGEYNLELDNEEDIPGYSICYLNDSFALITSQNGLVFLINTKTKEIVEEVIIENHEPLPASNYYPVLKSDLGLCTDLSYFECFGNNVVFVYRRDKGIENEFNGEETLEQRIKKSKQRQENWKDSIIIIPITKFISNLVN